MAQIILFLEYYVDFDEKSRFLDDLWGATTKLGMPETFKSMEKMLWDMDNAMQKTKRQ